MNNFNFDLDNNIDEDFFGSLKGKSNLQQLFSDDSISQNEKQQSLKYQRPKATDLKQSLQNDSDASTSAKQVSLTLLAKVVVAYTQGELQGKVGLALIQNSDNSCSLIIYKTKSHLLATIKLEPGRNLLHKQNNFWQFYDEQSVYWSFSFESLEDEEQFKENLKNKNLTFQEAKVTNSIENETMKPEEITNVQSITETKDNKIPSSKVNKKSKNTLIERMAKMGKPLPTLPSFNQQTTTELSDSSDTEIINTPLSLAQNPTIAPRNNKLSTIKSNQQFTSSTLNAGAVYPINPLESQYMQMLLTEQRTQGSELRMNMNKLENKIEKVLDKLELFDRQDGKAKPNNDNEILELEEKLLRLKKENLKLKQSIEERSSNDDIKIKEIFQETNIIIKDLTEKLHESQLQLREENERQTKLFKEQEEMYKINLQHKETNITEYQQQINDLNHKIEELTKEKLQIPPDNLIKSIMNNLYSDIADKLNNSNLTQSEQILSMIASSIQQQTLKSLQRSSLKND